MSATPIVSTPGELARLVARVRDAGRVAIDTEFHAERTYSPRLMLVQIAFDDGAEIVDALALPDLRSLADALTQTTVVGHALSADLKIFADRFDRVPPRVFDTQVAAAFLGYGMQISLADLVRAVCNVRLTKSQTVSDWSTRPLSERQVEYLIGDVAHLLPLYDALRDRLEAKGRYTWVYEECAELGDIDRYRIDERRAYLRIPGRNPHEPSRTRHSQRAGEAARRSRTGTRSSGSLRAPRRRRRGSRHAQAGAPRRSRTAAPSRRRHEATAWICDSAGRRARSSARRSRSSATAGASVGAGARRARRTARIGGRGDRACGRAALELARSACGSGTARARDSKRTRRVRTRARFAAVAFGVGRRAALAAVHRPGGGADRRLR